MRVRRRSLWKGPALITALILLIPLLGNRFVDGWNWGVGAFVLLGTLVFGIGLAYQLVTRNADTIAYRAAVGLALALALPLFWMNWVQAADDVNLAALMYFWVLIVGIIGAALGSGYRARVWRECVVPHVVYRIGVVVSDSRAWTIRTGRGITTDITMFGLAFGISPVSALARCR